MILQIFLPDKIVHHSPPLGGAVCQDAGVLQDPTGRDDPRDGSWQVNEVWRHGESGKEAQQHGGGRNKSPDEN